MFRYNIYMHAGDWIEKDVWKHCFSRMKLFELRKAVTGLFLLLLAASTGFLFYYMENRTLKEESLTGKGAAIEQKWSEVGEGYRLYYDESSGTYSYQIFSLENVPSNDLAEAVFLDDTTLEIKYYVGED